MSNEQLREIAASIARHYGLREPAHVRWQALESCWAMSQPEAGVIVVDTSLADEPDSVLDAVLHHELIHITYPELSDDDEEFLRLTAQDPHAEEAARYLAGACEQR